jgi:uncharacterized protein (UPF0332 family)
MDSKLYLERANNEIKLAEIIISLSKTPQLQLDVFKIAEPETYYSAVISHCYYSIFYSAKAILSTRGVTTDMPHVHQKTLQAFNKFLVKTGKLDKSLLSIYEDLLVKADVLLDIFTKEKGKRGDFTYKKLPQANVEPATESFNHATLFFKTINRILREEQSKNSQSKA